MKCRIKESKNIFPCTVYTENQDYDEVYYYLDTPEYGLSWRSFDDVEQEDIENYKYIIKNIADLRKAIDDLEEDFIHGYGNSYFKLSENYMEDLLNRGKTLVRVKKEHKERVYIIRVKPAQNVELALAESFEKTIRNLQKEGLFENVKSFDLDFTGKEIAVKLNESTSLNEMADIDRMDWNEVLPNPYASSPHVKNIHPELRWCEFLAAAYFYPKAHNGDLLHPQVYQGKAGWANPNQDVPYFTWLTQAGYIERVKTPGSIGKGAYKVTPAGERVMRYMIRAFGERACNPFEVVKGDRMDRHNLEPRKTKQKDQMYQGEVAFSYQGVHDAAPRERTVLPVAVYDRDIDVGDQRRIFGYDTGNMDERTVRALKRIFYNVNQEMKDKLGVESDLKGIKLSQLITNNFSEEENEIYKAIQDKARGRIAAYDADKYYRNFKLDRAEKVEPTNRGSIKTGKLNADDRAFFDANHSSNYIEDDFED